MSSSSSKLPTHVGRFEVMNFDREPVRPAVTIQQKIFFICMTVAVGLFSYLIARGIVNHTAPTYSVSSTGTISKTVLTSIKFYNEYTKNTSYSGIYNWENIVEPFKITYFEVPAFANMNSYDYVWYLDGWHIAEGSKMSFTFDAPTGSFQTIKVDAVDKNRAVVLSWSLDVMCKYVRREIRSLVEQDRIAFFQAINVIYRVPTQTGKLLYGPNYRSKDFFTRIHLYYGGSKECDHWHQGPGFVVTHFSLSNMFEKALQAVNPAVTLAYWDFTMESTFYEPETFRGSAVFYDDWFGDPAPTNKFKTITSGRWAYLSTMRNARNFSEIVSTYGMLRSPWNSDSTPYVTRSANIYGTFNNLKPSGCKEYNDALQFRTWSLMALSLNTNTHGHLHELMGGSWGLAHSVTIPDASQSGYANAYEFAHSTEANSKILWRAGWLECPDGKEATYEEYAAAGAKRVCQCPVLRTYSAKEQAQVLYDVGILASLVYSDKNGNAINTFMDGTTPYSTIPGYTDAETAEIYAAIVGVFCDVGSLGDMFQATSTNDVTFWVLHPTMERMWHLTQLNYQKGLIPFDATWDDSGTSTCPGHFSYSVTPFKNLWDSKNIPYSNRDLFTLLHPDNLDYVYDHFNWPHCNFLNYPMSGL